MSNNRQNTRTEKKYDLEQSFDKEFSTDEQLESTLQEIHKNFVKTSRPKREILARDYLIEPDEDKAAELYCQLYDHLRRLGNERHTIRRYLSVLESARKDPCPEYKDGHRTI